MNPEDDVLLLALHHPNVPMDDNVWQRIWDCRFKFRRPGTLRRWKRDRLEWQKRIEKRALSSTRRRVSLREFDAMYSVGDMEFRVVETRPIRGGHNLRRKIRHIIHL